MQSGRLNRTIQIERLQIKKNDYGEETAEWHKHITTRASVTYQQGNRQNENNEIFFAYQVTFTIRIYHDINELDRICYNGKLYRILSIETQPDWQCIIIRTELINE